MSESEFEKRGDASEGIFAHEAEMNFKAIVLRNRKLGAWAADLMGLDGAEKEAYAESLIMASIANFREDAVFEKLLDDFDVHKVDCSDRNLRRQMETLLLEAKDEISQIK